MFVLGLVELVDLQRAPVATCVSCVSVDTNWRLHGVPREGSLVSQEGLGHGDTDLPSAIFVLKEGKR